MATAEYSEDCCFNDIRDHCPLRGSQPCDCACHATSPPQGGYMEGFRSATGAADVAIKALIAENARLKEALRLTYGYAAAIQRMSVFAPIGFRCSLIRETVSRALPDDEAKRLHDETEIILDTLTEK